MLKATNSIKKLTKRIKESGESIPPGVIKSLPISYLPNIFTHYELEEKIK